MSSVIGGHIDLVFVPPQGGDEYSPEASQFNFEGDLNSPTTLTAVFKTKFDMLEPESSVTNPLQLKSFCKVRRYGLPEWRGMIFSRRTLEETEDGQKLVEIQMLDLVGWLRRVFAVWTGNGKNEYKFTVSTPPLAQSNVELFQLDPIGDAQWVYAPEAAATADPASSSMWLPNANVNSVAIRQSMTNVSPADGASIQGPAVTETGASTMLPGGIISITTGGNTEYIQYDGYLERNDGYFWFNNIKRGVCGTTAIAHTTGDTAYQRQSKRVSPVGIQEVTGTNGAGAKTIEDKNYDINPDDGLVYFHGDPAPLSGDGSDPYTSWHIVEYSVYDETNTTAFPAGRLTLSYIAQQFFEAAVSAAGPGFTGTDYDIDINPEIVLTRLNLDSPEFLLTLFERLGQEIGLNKGSSTDALGIWDDASASTVCYKSIAQKDTPDHIFENVKSIASDYSIEDISGQILVNYRSAQPPNLASAARTWFSEVTGGAGYKDTGLGSGNHEPSHYTVQPASDSDPAWSTPASGISELNNNGAHLMFDGNENTGFGLCWQEANNPGSGCDIFYFHFNDPVGGVCASERIKRIKINYDMSSGSDTTNQAQIRVYGLTGFVPGDTSAKPTYTASFDLSASLRQKYSIGDTTSFKNAVLEGNNIGVNAEAIMIVFDGLPTEDGFRKARIREVLVEGDNERQVLIQITDSSSAALDATYIYAPDTYAKIFDATTGLGLADKIDVGVASYWAAVSFGRLALVQALALPLTKQFEITGEFRTIPDFADTVRFFPNQDNEFTGVVIGRSYDCDSEGERLILSVIDFRGGIFGS